MLDGLCARLLFVERKIVVELFCATDCGVDISIGKGDLVGVFLVSPSARAPNDLN